MFLCCCCPPPTSQSASSPQYLPLSTLCSLQKCKSKTNYFDEFPLTSASCPLLLLCDLTACCFPADGRLAAWRLQLWWEPARWEPARLSQRVARPPLLCGLDPPGKAPLPSWWRSLVCVLSLYFLTSPALQRISSQDIVPFIIFTMYRTF